MAYKKSIKLMAAVWLCLILLIVVFIPAYGTLAKISFIAEVENTAASTGEAAIYWNPERKGTLTELATGSNSEKSYDFATKSNVRGFLTRGSHPADGLTPETAVKNLNDAIRKAEKLSEQLEMELSNVIIYAMNPMVISSEMAYTVRGNNVAIVPWEGWANEEEAIFIVEGGRLSLSNLTIRTRHINTVPEAAALLYISSGVVQLGAQVEVDGTFVLDYRQGTYHQSLECEAVETYPGPVIELTKRFDFTSDAYHLLVQMPEDCKQDAVTVNALFSDERTADDYRDIFKVVNNSVECELLVEERFRGDLYDAAVITEMRAEEPIRTRKRLIARQVDGLTQRGGSSNDFINLPLGGNEIASGDEKKLIVMEADADAQNGYYQAYTADESGLRLALFDLYEENQPASDYIMYLGSDITNISPLVFQNTDAAAGPGDVTFASLKGRLNTLVLTGHHEDLVTDTALTSAPVTAAHISIWGNGERFFGCDIILRNIRHSFNAGTIGSQGVYMNGYSLTLGGGSWQTSATRYFGGGSSGTIIAAKGTAEMKVYSTGNGASFFIGGMRTGTIDGNAAITVYGTSGNHINIRGGGLGLSVNAGANITGSVTNTINGMSAAGTGLHSFVGGVEYGTVGGQITNSISGTGRFSSNSAGYTWGTADSCFIGGSLYGNIGSDATLGGSVETADVAVLADTDDYVIKNRIDISGFSFGRTAYFGSNYAAGIVKGNILNIVTAGADSQGSISVFSGGAGHSAAIGGTWPGSFTVNPATAQVSNTEAGLAAAKAASGYQLYGNTTNLITKGCICAGGSGDNGHWFRGAGWGYVEGNVYSELGTEGLVYLGNYNRYSYSVTSRSQGYNTGFDLTGGGGDISANNSLCINGNTTLVTRNVLARWTYGGNFGGVQIGDSLRIHYGGVVDTLEGTGYNNYIQVGDGRAEVHGGQVDWFLCGGGWNDSYQDGNVSVEVFDKPDVIINASLGGTYGASLNHSISGDSSVVVHGGNFSGTARDAVFRGFSAGPSNAGYIYGNASVTLDLRGNQYGFAIEPGDSISGGRRFNSGIYSYLGSSTDNTITLNILTDEARTDLLNGLNIYGDCSGTTDSIGNTRAGHIILNVNAPGDNIGSLYATNYSNLSGAVLRRNVQVNLVSAQVITGLCAGNGTENITNTVAAASALAGRYAIINVGPRSDNPEHLLGERETDQTADGLPHRIHVSTNGIIGFTTMDIRKRLLIADQGDIKNGLHAQAGTHGTSYHLFGDLTLHAGKGVTGAGLGITSANASFIAGTAYVEGDGLVYIQSTGQVDQVVLTDIIISGSNALEWLKVGEVNPENDLQTNWFGVSSGWRVVTLNPDKAKAAEHINPVNFRGIEEATGKTFIGDSDTHYSGNNGYAIAIPGSVFTWEVTAGDGMVSHNVPVATAPPSLGQPIKAYGTVAAGTPAVKGSIAIPSAAVPDTVPYPVFTFIPDSGGEWLEQADIYGSDRYISQNPHHYTVGAGDWNQTKTWAASGDDKDYSFHIEARFMKGAAQVTARDVIITETEAAAIEGAGDVIAFTQASGNPLFQNNISNQLLAQMRAPLVPHQVWRTHLIQYTAGNEVLTGNQVQIMVHVVVVKDGTAIAANRQYGLYAQDAVLTLKQAQAISNQNDLDSSYTNAVVILANGTTAQPSINDEALPEISNVTAALLPKAVPVSYTYTADTQSEEITKPVVVSIQDMDEAEVTISKLVAGDYSDRTKGFLFQIYFRDNYDMPLPGGTELVFTGGIVSGSGAEKPDDGKLLLNQEGEAAFVLKHGQQITISGVPQGQLRIIETVDSNYSVSITGSSMTGTVDGSDTGMVSIEKASINFDFTNRRYNVVPTGIRFIQKEMFLLYFVLLSAAMTALLYHQRKRSFRND